MVAESWFQSLWKSLKKDETIPPLMIEVLAFEVASLMSKLVHIWKSLSDKQVAKLRDSVTNSIAIKNLISEDDEYIVRLISSEIIENLGHVAKAVTRFSKKCSDPYLKKFEHVFKDMIKIGEDPYGWNYTWKKMDRKVKKMERFIFMNSNLYQGLELLTELKHTLERIKANKVSENAVIIAYQKKIAWKKQEVKQFKVFSLWNRSYDYVVRLLARSLFTVYRRIGYVFGIGLVVDFEIKDSKLMDSIDIFQNQFSSMMQSSVHPSENSGLPRFSSGPLKPIANGENKSKTGLSPLYGGDKAMNFYSGPLESSTNKTGRLSRPKKTNFKLWHEAIKPLSNTTRFENTSDLKNSHLSIIEPKQKWLNAPPETLGAAALALHYANLIIVIEKLAETPHLIDDDARDDLYNMLPSSLRVALKAKLRPLNLSNYDSALAKEWSEAILVILEWLAPLAHNTIRWHTERSFEHQNMGSKVKVLLVQTLYFANQEKTEATITEVLVGLNYVWRYGRTIGTSFEVD